MKHKFGGNAPTVQSFFTSPYARELCVTNTGRQSVRRDSSLQQLSLRMTPADAHFFGVILSAAKDLARQRVSRHHRHKVTQRSLVQGESSVPLSLSKERVGERSSEDFNDSLKAPVAQRNSRRPLPPLAMLAATSPWTRRGEERRAATRVLVKKCCASQRTRRPAAVRAPTSEARGECR